MDITERILGQPVDLEPILELTPELVQKRRSQVRIIFDRFIRNKAALGGAIFLFSLFVFCFLGPAFTGHTHPDALHLNDAIQSPSLKYPFGTDDVGRDQLARAMAGGQVSLLVGLSSMAIGLAIAITVGAVAGFYGGLIDNALMRVVDVFQAVPVYLLLFVLSASFADGSPRSIITLIALFSWADTSRIVRGEFLAQKEREYILAARTIGANNLRLMFRHILPNVIGSITVSATLMVGGNIILESVLSFFNFGLRPPSASWGNMVADGQALYDVAPWLVFAPALLVFFTVLCCNLVGDGLRDAFDPYMTER
jgi:peptide/nickel transport system permease protein